MLPEGVENLNNNDLKGFDNLIYLRLPNSIKNIEENVFNNTPCLNFENISDHPIIRRIKRKKLKSAKIFLKILKQFIETIKLKLKH